MGGVRSDLRSRFRFGLPAIALFLLAPATGELLSGSSPPAEFFHPFGFTVMALLYGGGAILVRELTLRWGGEWRRFFLLAMAYGIVEEGLMCKSFFDPAWPDLDVLATYGRWLGVNWVWAVDLTMYHMTVSIFVPVVLTGVLFASRARESWVGPRTLRVLLGLLVADVVFGYVFISSYRLPLLAALLTLLLVIALVVAARRVRVVRVPPSARSAPPARRFLLVGSACMFLFLVVMWGLPHTGIHPVFSILAAGGLAVLAWRVLERMSSLPSGWAEDRRLALAAGLLLPFILIAPIQEFDAARADDTSGMTLVGLAFLVFLLWLWRRVRRSRHSNPAAPLS